MIEKTTLNFLKDLAANNEREWFQENKSRYTAAQDNITAFAGYLIGELGKFDHDIPALDPKSCVFRIYRDVRFAKDKSPYKTNLGAYISPGGRKSTLPGYYIHVEPGRSFIAGGKYMPDGPELLRIRTAIADNTDAFLKIVGKKSFRDTFGEVSGERLKSAPKGFDPAHKAVEFLKLKAFTAFQELPDDDVLTTPPDLSKPLIQKFKEMYPLIAFLRDAMETDRT